MKIEPVLITVSSMKFKNKTTNAIDDARVDVSARGFWTKGRKAFLDIRVLNPFAKIYLQPRPGQIELPSLKSAYRVNEQAKKREYNGRILQVEHGTFTPLVFSTFGGLGYECNRFIKTS